jgi:formylglycine-generating enzyme required for sulfatase activity
MRQKPSSSSCCAAASGEDARAGKNLQNGSIAGMRRLEGGEFLMGADSDMAWPGDGEGPVRTVSLDPFYIDICTVSNRQWEMFVTATRYVTEAEKFGWSYIFYRDVPNSKAAALSKGSVAQADWWLAVEGACWHRPQGPGSNVRKRPDHPVVHISWHDAQAYCNWASKRLPTEAEWEHAARGGLVQKTYPWGDELTPGGKHQCNIWQGKFPDFDSGSDGHRGIAPVRAFAPNGFGLYNMAGNVWEWTSDWFSATHPTVEPILNPAGPAFGERKVIRGGSYLCHASYCNRYRVAARTSNTPDSSTCHTGFRCAHDA